MTTKFLHSADWQIGLKVNFAREHADRLREVRYQTAEKIIDFANAESVNFILLAGDTFDAEWLAEEHVQRVVQILGQSASPVFVLPGNHDPLRAGSLWESKSWQSRPSNVVLLDHEEPVNAPGCTLYPCPLRQKQSGSNPTTWIPRRKEEDGIRVGVAHGALDTLGKPLNFPIPPNAADILELDYLALGDWHGLTVAGRLAYPGTPEPCRFEEVNPGSVLIVEIAGSAALPQIRSHRVATLKWTILSGIAESPDAVTDLFPMNADDLRATCFRIRIDVTTSEARAALVKASLALAEAAFWVDLPAIDDFIQEPVELPIGIISQIDEILGDNQAARVELRRILKEVIR